MLVSILHRVTGVGLATIGVAVFVWWLTAAASGPDAYQDFVGWATWPWFLLVWIPLSWAFFQHLLSGLRHFVMDLGAGYELNTNKFWASMTLAGSVVLTSLFWLYIMVVR